MSRIRLLSVILVIAVVCAAMPVPSARADDGIKIMSGNYMAQYYSNISLAGSPAVTRTDATINFLWADGSPDPAIPVDNFSARWTGNFYFATAGSYTFKVTADDGVRLWVDSTLLIDKWVDQSPATYTASASLTAATHIIKLEYYEHLGHATITLAWGMGGPSGTFFGEYFNNMSLFGAPALTRVDPTVDFNWGWGAPDPLIITDYFSARWTAVANFPTTGNYTFHMMTDDGARLWLDGVLILDRWYPQAATDHTVVRSVGAGPHNLKMEYFEEAGLAVARLWWEAGGPGGGPDVIIDDLGPGFTKGGPWRQAPIGYNGHMFWTRNATATQENWGRWTPALSAPGMYEAYAYIPSNYATTRNARYTVYHNGVWNTRVINQYIYSNVWVSLGTYRFSAGGGEFVFMNDVTGEPYLSRQIGFDAVKFSYRGP